MSEQGPSLDGPHFLIAADGSIHGEDTPENREIARRFRACVQACEGIPTEDLENDIVQEMRRVIGQVVPLLEEKKEVEQQLQDERNKRTTSPASSAGTIRGM